MSTNPSTNQKLRLLLYFLLMISYLGAFIYILPRMRNPENNMYYNKAPVLSTMKKIIENGGDLSSIKHIYDHRIAYSGSDLSPKKQESSGYAMNYPLSDILNDLKVEYLNSNEPKDSTYLLTLESLIAENNKMNPFDNLEENQKYHFQNIQEKLDTTYEKISPDINKIADDLKDKNELVAKYLNQSDSSYTISIVAIVLTLFLGLFQILQNYLTSKKIDELKERRRIKQSGIIIEN